MQNYLLFVECSQLDQYWTKQKDIVYILEGVLRIMLVPLAWVSMQA